LADPSSFSRTEAITLIVAVACTLTGGAEGGGDAVAKAAAAMRNMSKANAVAGKW